MANPVEDRYAELLLEKISGDMYPSATHMAMLEEVASGEVLAAYVMRLMERIEDDQYPSIPMLRRVQRLAAKFGD